MLKFALAAALESAYDPRILPGACCSKARPVEGKMAFCPNCGAQVEGKFCASCGKPVGEATGGPAGATATAGGLQDNVAAALCYLLGVITGVLFLVIEPYNKNREIRFHAFQSIFFCIAVFVIYIVLTIVGTVLPVVGWIISGLLTVVVWLGSLVLWLLLMWKAYNRHRWVLPVIGPMAEKQAG